MHIDDLQDARPKKATTVPHRDVFKVKDIQGTAPKQPYLRKTAHDGFTYADVYRN